LFVFDSVKLAQLNEKNKNGYTRTVTEYRNRYFTYSFRIDARCFYIYWKYCTTLS